MMPPLAGADVVVVGGGLVGASLAYELVTAGAATVLVDRHDPGGPRTPERGSCRRRPTRIPTPTSLPSGIAAAHHYRVADRPPCRRTASPTPASPSSVHCSSPSDPATTSSWNGPSRLIGGRCPDVEEIDPAEASRHFPPLAPVRRALFNPAGRRVDGRVLNAALRQAAVSRGVRVVDGRRRRPRGRRRSADGHRGGHQRGDRPGRRGGPRRWGVDRRSWPGPSGWTSR